MYGFITKLKVFDFAMNGGILDGMVKLQKRKAAKNKI